MMNFIKSKKGIAVIVAMIVAGLVASGVITQEQAMSLISIVVV